MSGPDPRWLDFYARASEGLQVNVIAELLSAQAASATPEAYDAMIKEARALVASADHMVRFELLHQLDPEAAWEEAADFMVKEMEADN